MHGAEHRRPGVRDADVYGVERVHADDADELQHVRSTDTLVRDTDVRRRRVRQRHAIDADAGVHGERHRSLVHARDLPRVRRVGTTRLPSWAHGNPMVHDLVGHVQDCVTLENEFPQ